MFLQHPVGPLQAAQRLNRQTLRPCALFRGKPLQRPSGIAFRQQTPLTQHLIQKVDRGFAGLKRIGGFVGHRRSGFLFRLWDHGASPGR